MLKIVHAADLYRRPALAASMFRDRAVQFRDRLRWDVNVDDMGMEFDQYDSLDPIYVIEEDEAGEHLGSGRILPTTGRTMIGEHFADLMGDTQFSSPRIWEITRFCISPRATRRQAMTIPTSLLWAGSDLALRTGVEFCIAVFNAPMLRIYKSIGCAPEVLGVRSTEEGDICGGIWEITPQLRERLSRRLGVEATERPCYFPQNDRFDFSDGAFGRLPEAVYAKAG